jgi:hypothetical protein
MTRRAPPVSTIAPPLPRDVAAYLDRALEWEQDRRWPDARTMQAAVRAALEAWRSRFASNRRSAVRSETVESERSSLAALRLLVAVLIGVIGGSHLATMQAARALWAPAAVASLARRHAETAIAEIEIEQAEAASRNRNDAAP